MTKLEIQHHTQYDYDKEVFLEPHYLGFMPQNRPYLKLINYGISIAPEPSGKFDFINAENNFRHQIWYNNPLSSLEISVSISLETTRANPFGFLIDRRDGQFQTESASYLAVNESLSGDLLNYLKPFKLGFNLDEPLECINSLLSAVNEGWGHEVRYENDIHSPNYCFKKRNGSCRDISWMFIHMLRSIGVPARFVSGYSYNPELGSGHELHAWVEALIPGPGWVGVDPSAGIYTTEYYIPVSTSHDAINTLPVHGTFRGTAKSALKTSVEITVS